MLKKKSEKSKRESDTNIIYNKLLQKNREKSWPNIKLTSKEEGGT